MAFYQLFLLNNSDFIFLSFLSFQILKYCIENDGYSLLTFATLSRYTCLYDIKASGITLPGIKLSQSHATAPVTSRRETTV